MNKKQTRVWDKLSGQDGETVLRLLTSWHGLQLLDEGFMEHLAAEGYIDEDNCKAGTYDCASCLLCGKCILQCTMEAAMEADTFDDFCKQFPGSCKGCPMAKMKNHPCEERHWLKWKEKLCIKRGS